MNYLIWIGFAFLVVFGQPIQAAEDPTAPPAEAVYARVAELCWEAPAAYANGTPLDPLTEIAQYEVEVQQPSGITTHTAGKEVTYSHLITANGEHCFRVRAQATNLMFSEWAAPVCTDIQSAPMRIEMRFCK